MLIGVSLEPTGLQFNQPATLTLPHTGWQETFTALRTDHQWDDDWSAIGPIRDEGDAVSLEIAGFSAFGLSTVPDGACPGLDAGDVAHWLAEGERRGHELIKSLDWPEANDSLLFRTREGSDDLGSSTLATGSGFCFMSVYHPDGADYDAWYPDAGPLTDESANVS